MTKQLVIVAAVLLIYSVAGCGTDSSPNRTNENERQTDKAKYELDVVWGSPLTWEGTSKPFSDTASLVEILRRNERLLLPESGVELHSGVILEGSFDRGVRETIERLQRPNMEEELAEWASFVTFLAVYTVSPDFKEEGKVRTFGLLPEIPDGETPESHGYRTTEVEGPSGEKVVVIAQRGSMGLQYFNHFYQETIDSISWTKTN